MVDIEGILEQVVVKVIGHASRKNAFWLISMDRDCIRIKLLIINFMTLLNYIFDTNRADNQFDSFRKYIY
jgi:hypothetical protein